MEPGDFNTILTRGQNHAEMHPFGYKIPKFSRGSRTPILWKGSITPLRPQPLATQLSRLFASVWSLPLASCKIYPTNLQLRWCHWCQICIIPKTSRLFSHLKTYQSQQFHKFYPKQSNRHTNQQIKINITSLAGLNTNQKRVSNYQPGSPFTAYLLSIGITHYHNNTVVQQCAALS